MLVAVAATGCASSTVTVARTSTTASPTTQATVIGEAPSDEVISLLEGRIAAWNRGDGKAAAAFYAEDGILEETDNGLVTQGRSRIAARLQDLIDGGFTMETAGTPIQFGRVVVEPVNLIYQGQPGLYVLVFDLGPDGRLIDHQWAMPAAAM